MDFWTIVMCSSNQEIIIYDVYWEGPYSLDIITQDRTGSIVKDWHCLYQVYGDHPTYGRDVLLYIGKTERDVKIRLSEHYNRFSNQCDEVKVFFASFGEFTSWQEMREENYDPVSKDNTELNAIESLLIYAHQPAYNIMSLSCTQFQSLNFRLFNTGRRKSLMPEISTQFYRDDITIIKKGYAMSFPPYTNREREIISCLKTYQNEFIDPTGSELCPEIHVLIDNHGNIINENQVSPNGGHLTITMQLFAKENLCCLIHNHPSNKSLSQSDWNVLSHFPKLTMVAVNSKGSTFRGKVIFPQCFSDWHEEINDIYYKIERDISNYLGRLSINYEYYSDLFDKISWFIGVHIGDALLKKGYVDYEYNLEGDNPSLWNDTKHKVIHEELERLCNLHIP